MVEGVSKFKTKIELKDKLILAGLFALEDPAREEVPPAIKSCNMAGVRVIMVTGDFSLTAQAIAKDANKGGLAYCFVRAMVYNYMVPEKFLQSFSAVNLTEKKDHRDGKVIDKYTQFTADAKNGLNVFLRDKAALSFDTWALDNGAKTMKDKDTSGGNEYASMSEWDNETDHPYFKRMAIAEGNSQMVLSGNLSVASASYAIYTARAVQFLTTGSSNKVFAAINPNPTIYLAMSPVPPTSPLINLMQARYKRGPATGGETSFGDGYLAKCPFKWDGADGLERAAYANDVILCGANTESYETTPYKKFSDNPNQSPYVKAYKNRGPYYMSSTNQNQVWKP